jgi:hypothetical protein
VVLPADGRRRYVMNYCPTADAWNRNSSSTLLVVCNPFYFIFLRKACVCCVLCACYPFRVWWLMRDRWLLLQFSGGMGPRGSRSVACWIPAFCSYRLNCLLNRYWINDCNIE